MTDPLTPSGPGGFADDVTGGHPAGGSPISGPDDLTGDGIVLGGLSTPGAGDAGFADPADPAGPAAFYTHSGTPCG